MTDNKQATRYYSGRHEESIARALGGSRRPSSGSSKFDKGDVVHDGASMLIEAKCTMSEKQSVSIKREWLDKNKAEAFSIRKSNHCLCFNFGPESPNYYVIDEKLMKFLIEKLEEENKLVEM